MDLLNEKSSKRLINFGFIILIVGVFIFAWKDNFFNWNTEIQSDKVGQFGDFVGGIIGSIWALAGVVLFYVALKEQRKDIKINKDALEAQVKALNQQIEEFKLQKIELAQTREVFKIQSETLKKQQFESTFFNLLGLHQSNISDMDVTEKVVKDRLGGSFALTDDDFEKVFLSGRDCFMFFVKELRGIYENNKHHKEYSNRNYVDEKDLLLQSYDEFFNVFQPDLGHYFRTLYHIYKFVKFSDINDKNRYTSIIRAQLSNDELVMLFYNCISNNGEKFKPIIEDFHVFKNLNFDGLLNNEIHIKYYSKAAYKKQKD